MFFILCIVLRKINKYDLQNVIVLLVHCSMTFRLSLFYWCIVAFISVRVPPEGRIKISGCRKFYKYRTDSPFVEVFLSFSQFRGLLIFILVFGLIVGTRLRVSSFSADRKSNIINKHFFRKFILVIYGSDLTWFCYIL